MRKTDADAGTGRNRGIRVIACGSRLDLVEAREVKRRKK